MREICKDPRDNPYNLEIGQTYKIRLYDGQIFIGRFSCVETEGVGKRYKFILGCSISLRVWHTEFSVIEEIADYPIGYKGNRYKEP